MRRILIVDFDLHHGGGIEQAIVSSGFGQRQRKSYEDAPGGGLEILYFSVYQKHGYDHKDVQMVTDKWNPRCAFKVHRMFSSEPGKWSSADTAARHALICKTVVDYGTDGGFDAVIVAAGFDHCVGEKLGDPRCPRGTDRFWTCAQMQGLGHAIHECASKCRLMKVPVSVLEGGYEADTMRKFLPAYAISSAGGPGASER
jgi:acetoin utilization deacetylase AcuC-like enzyme